MKIRLLFAVLFLISLSGCYSGKIKKAQERLETLRKELVPDSRIDLWQISVTKEKGKNVLVKGELLSQETRGKILQVIKDAGLRVNDSLVVLPDTLHLKKTWGLITLSVANLRQNPAHSAEMVTQAILGTPVRILKKKGGWCFIQTPDHYLAWTNGSSLQSMNGEELDQWNCSERVIFKDNYGVILKEGAESEIVNDLVAGSILKKISETAGVCTVALPDGRTGTIPSEKLYSFGQWSEKSDGSGDNLVMTARKFLGIPYLWGGTSSKAVDCSGLVKSVYFLNGIILERDASQQYRHGEEIRIDSTFSNVQPGDLFFFGTKDPLRITHVGMSIGKDEVIHSSVSNGRVYINSLDPDQSDFSQILYDSFVGVRRVISMQPQFGFMPVSMHEWYR
jgi:gamma-D-glutamyl-L-lysine dipeptidyl-peptidase